MSFYNRVMRIRAAASLLFDKGIAANTDKVEIAKQIEPLQKQFHELLSYEVRHSRVDLILSMRMFEENAKARLANSRAMRAMAKEELGYSRDIRAALFKELKQSGLSHFDDGGFLVTFSANGNGIEVR